jgi:hypothetical protein
MSSPPAIEARSYLWAGRLARYAVETPDQVSQKCDFFAYIAKSSYRREMDEDKLRFVVQVCLSAIVLAAGFGVLLFGNADKADTGVAACGVGLIFGYWMPDRRQDP